MALKSHDKAESTEMIAYKFVGYPDEEAKSLMTGFQHTCRFMWNKLHADNQDNYKATGESLIRTPAYYKKIPEYKWLKETDSLALSNVAINYSNAMNAFYNGTANFPKFKKRGCCKMSYKTNCSNKENPNLKLDGDMLTLPKVKNRIKLLIHRKIKEGGILKSCTVTQDENTKKWHFTLLYEYPKSTVTKELTPETMKHIGLDMSVPKLYVDSNGNTPVFIKMYKVTQDKLAKEQHRLSRMKKDSNNYGRQKARVAKLHAKIKHQRQDMLHKISKELTDTYDLISIEDLNIAGLKKALKLGKSVSDNGWGMFVTMLGYKQERKGHYLVKIDRWFPSSKTCHKCGHIHKELQLSDRTYVCPICGNTIDRDEQAAVNIDEEGLRIFIENGMRVPTPKKKKKSRKNSSKPIAA